MAKGAKIAHYREALDRTLASDDLTDTKKLESIVRDQILRSSEGEIRDYIDNVVEKRTVEVSNILELLRSASENHDALDRTHQTRWKSKQDTEEFRVMYREGPIGSPFHSLLVEGYIDAPLDVCLCVSWETGLYPRWFPETLIPTFKIAEAKSLQNVMIGEQISLVRMKLSWPLSSREAVLHYFEFEFLEDNLIVVLVNTIPDVDDIQMETHGFTSEEIPEAGNTVRMDVVGGFALQRVTESRSYFRTIYNMDIKLDFVPPSLINFVSRQLIGSGFRLFQKTVASVFKGDEAFAKVLSGPLYGRIREAILRKSEAKNIHENIQACAAISNDRQKSNVEVVSRNDNGMFLGSDHDNQPTNLRKPTSGEIQEVESYEINSRKYEEPLGVKFKVENHNVQSNGYECGHLPQYKSTTEIEEEEVKKSEHVVENRKVNDEKFKKEGFNSTDKLQSGNSAKNVRLSPEVEKALVTLDRMIDAVRQGRLKTLDSSQSIPQIVGGEATLLTRPKHVQWTDEQGAIQVLQEASDASINGIVPIGLRSTNPDCHAQEAKPDLPSAVQNPPIGSWSRNALSAGNSPIVDSSIISVHENKKSGQPRKWRLCCLHQFMEGWSRNTERKENMKGDVH